MRFLSLYYLLPLLLITGPFFSDLLISLTSLFFLYYFVRYEKNFLFNKLNLYFLLFYIYLLLISLFSVDIIYSYKSVVPYFRFFLFSLIICYALEKKILKIQYFYYVIVIIIFCLFLDSVYQLLVGQNILGQVPNLNYRITSFFGDKAVLGSYVFKIYILYIFLDYLNNGKNKNIIFYLISIMAVSIVTISGDRTPFYLMCIYFILLLLFSKFKKKYLFTFIIFFLIGSVIIFSNNTIKNRIIYMTTEGFFNTLEKFDQTKIKNDINYNFQNNKKLKYFISSDHHYHFVASKKIFIDKFLSGSGPNTFRLECPKFFDNKDKNYCSTHPHNFYFQISSETGIFPLILFICMFIYASFKLILQLIDKKNYDFGKVQLYIYLFIIFFPLSPNGNFFNNWLSILNYLPIGFFIYYFRNTNYFKSR